MKTPTYSDFMEAQSRLKEIDLAYWYHHSFLSLQWWILLGILILPWVVWGFASGRKRQAKQVVLGLYIIVLASISDTLGSNMQVWSYPYELVPYFPRALPFDVGLLPVFYMLLCERFQTTRSFVIAMLIASFVFAFIGEPLLVKLGIYKPIIWKYSYSFPIYFVIGVIGRAFVRFLR